MATAGPDGGEGSVPGAGPDFSWHQEGTKPLPLHPVTTGLTRFRVRVELEGSTPPIWRSLDLAADLTLDVLHDVLQVAFGFTNSHLHRFALTQDPLRREFEGILTPFDVEEGDAGVLESELRLDQLLATPGDTLLYTYDFGDDWEHLLTLEAIEPRGDGDAPVVRCIAGARRSPAEDVGGVRGWEELLAAAAGDLRLHPNHIETVRALGLTKVVDEIDLDAINRGLLRLAGAASALAWLQAQPMGPAGPSALAALVLQQRPEVQLVLAGYLAAGELAQPIDRSEAEAATAVIRAFLKQVGAGLRFTDAGYLPPAAVKAIMAAMDTDRRWLRPANREVQTYPVLQLRETVTLLGLTRKFKGELQLTAKGRALQDDPEGMLNYLAARLPAERTEAGSEMALLLLMLVAAGEAGNGETVAAQIDLLSSMIGWQYGDGGRYGNLVAIEDAFDTRAVLQWAGYGQLLPPRGQDRQGLGMPRARMLARAALTSWA